MKRAYLLAIPLMVSALQMGAAQDPTLESAGAPYAPLEVSKQTGRDPSVPLSHSERDELLSEFRGLVHMGLHPVVYERWEGKEMADCDKSTSKQDRWSYRCEIITGQGNGY